MIRVTKKIGVENSIRNVRNNDEFVGVIGLALDLLREGILEDVKNNNLSKWLFIEVANNEVTNIHEFDNKEETVRYVKSL